MQCNANFGAQCTLFLKELFVCLSSLSCSKVCVPVLPRKWWKKEQTFSLLALNKEHFETVLSTLAHALYHDRFVGNSLVTNELFLKGFPKKPHF